jgi:uncharacterized radical SAM superfamily Fe-S cluster-containing enzyme
MKAQEWRQALGEIVRDFFRTAEMEHFYSVKMTRDRARIYLLQLGLYACQRRHNWPQVAANCPVFEVKQRAIDNLHDAGVDITLVTTIVNTINNHQVGPIIRFLIDNIEKVNALSFQPVSFTGRDEDIDDATRSQQRYTLSHLAHDVKGQLGITEPMRDWFPLSAAGPFSDLKDLLSGPGAEWGSLKCGCHPNCGIGTFLLINQETKQAVPATQLVDSDRILKDVQVITDSSRGHAATVFQMVLAIVRNMRVGEFPENLSVRALLKSLDGLNSAALGIADRARYSWRPVMVAGMWFQDLFNYDFRRTEMCIIPYGTQQGEISFCAYNTGVGWRQIIENMHMTASTSDWYKSVGRHKVYAGGKSVPLPIATPASSHGACGCHGAEQAVLVQLGGKEESTPAGPTLVQIGA